MHHAHASCGGSIAQHVSIAFMPVCLHSPAWVLVSTYQRHMLHVTRTMLDSAWSPFSIFSSVLHHACPPETQLN
jgi:hypothetical protein